MQNKLCIKTEYKKTPLTFLKKTITLTFLFGLFILNNTQAQTISSTGSRTTNCSICTPDGWTNNAGTPDVSSKNKAATTDTTGGDSNWLTAPLPNPPTGDITWISMRDVGSLGLEESVNTTLGSIIAGKVYKITFYNMTSRTDITGEGGVNYAGTYETEFQFQIADYPKTNSLVGTDAHDQWTKEQFIFIGDPDGSGNMNLTVYPGLNSGAVDLATSNLLQCINIAVDLNAIELIDTDGDGIDDSIDVDDDNDGILDTVETTTIGGTTYDPLGDADGDKIPNYFDVLDNTGDPGTIAGDGSSTNYTDANSDGIADIFDFDDDGIPNHLDLDSDNDGIPDNIEAQTTAGYLAPSGAGAGITDVNNNGLDDNYETAEGGTDITPVNTDAAGEADFRDLDSDGDGTNDTTEAGLLIAGSVGNNGLNNTYDNGDTYADVNGSFDNTQTDNFPDTTVGGDVDWRDNGTTGGPDTDSDGVLNSTDVDDDNDGILDITESGGNNPDGDADGDGILNYLDTTNGGGAGDGSTTNYTDTDGNGIPDVYDTDGDGIPNHLDLDSDNDGIPDNIEAQSSLDATYIAPSGAGAGITDVNNNGLDDNYETAEGGTDITPVNTDGTGNADYLDTDSDDDGVLDRVEANLSLSGTVGLNGLDNNYDNGGADDYADVNGSFDNTPQDNLPDADGDVASGGDLDYRDADSFYIDNDNDGVIDSIDLDDDNDGILDVDEMDCTGLATGNSDTGTGTLKDNIYWFNWSDASFSNGINIGDSQTFTLPDGSIITATVTAASITGGSGATTDYVPVDMQTWVDAKLYGFYNTPGSTEVFYNNAVDDVDIDFTIEFTATNNGISFMPDLIVSDGESTDETTESFIIDTDGENWESLENIPQATAQTTVSGTQVSSVGIAAGGNGFNIYRSKNATSIRTRLVCAAGGKQGVTFGLYLKCLPKDTDGDGIPNHFDLDSDGDGIPDNIEAQATVGYTTPNGTFDANGVDTAYTGGLTPINTDTIDEPDYLDTDSDNDGIHDRLEAGIILSGVVGINGLDNNYDNGDNYTDVNGSFDDSQSDNFPDEDGDVFSSGDVDYRDDTFTGDNDGDGINDEVDLDDDNDGILDSEEYGTICGVGIINANLNWEVEYTNGTTDHTTGDDPIIVNPNLTIAGVGITLSRFSNITGTQAEFKVNDAITANGTYNLWKWGTTTAESRHIFDFDTPIRNLTFTMYDLNKDGNPTDNVQILLTQEDGSTYNLTPADYTTGVGNTYIGSNTFEGTSTATDPDARVIINQLPVAIIKMQIVYKNTGLFALMDIAIGNMSFCVPLDSDGDGIFDFRDLDSDNDGIPDNIEAQSTTGYIAPTNTYSVTGIDIAYGTGLTTVDTDGDGAADYIDLDADADGTFDIAESGGGLADADVNGMIDAVNVGTNGLHNTLEAADTYADVNGTFDDTQTDNFTDTDGDVNSGGDVDYRDTTVGVDTDGDGIPDTVDIDDDNDGILDEDECGTTTLEAEPTMQDMQVRVGTAQYSPGQINQNVNTRMVFELVDPADPGTTIAVCRITVTNIVDNGHISVIDWTVTDDSPQINIKTTGGGVGDTEYATLRFEFFGPTENQTNLLTGAAGTTPTDFTFMYGVRDLDNSPEPRTESISADGLKVSGYILEGATTLTYSNVTVPGSHTFTGTVNNPTDIVKIAYFNVQTFNADIRSTDSDAGFIFDFRNTTVMTAPVETVIKCFTDTDGDGIPDQLDIDADNDGIPDNVEAQTTLGYTAPSGIGAGITDVNGNGLDDNYEVGLGGIDISTTPNDDDGDGTPDYLDADSDNDGTPDIEENGDADNVVSGIDTDGDGLDDNFEGADTNDGFDVNDEINTPQTDLPDVDSDVATGGPTHDVDFRDNVDDPVTPGVPGDILWLRADIGATVSSWLDQSGDAEDFTQPLVANQPTVVTGGLNFNPTIQFNGVEEDHMSNAGGILEGAGYNSIWMYAVFNPHGSQDTSIFREDEDLGSTDLLYIRVHNSTDQIRMRHGATGTNILTSATDPTINNRFNIFNYGAHINTTTPSGTGRSMYQNGLLIQSSGGVDASVGENAPAFVGSRNTTSRFFNGEIAEIMIFNTVPSALEQQHIQSYLGIKYGITLDAIDNDATIVEGDYLLKDLSTKIWDYTANSTYHNDVAGIGRDDEMTLLQKQAISIGSDAVIAIGLGSATGSIVADNALNAGSFSSNKDFLVWGNDNGAIATVTETELICAPERTIGRTWKIVETGTVGEVEVTIPISLIDAFLTTPNTVKVLKVADDAAFTTNVEYIPLATSSRTVDGVATAVYSANHDFNGTKYFTYSEINGIFWTGDDSSWNGGNNAGTPGAPSILAADKDKVLVIDAQISGNNATLPGNANVECVWVKTGSKLMIPTGNYLEFDEDFILDGEIKLIGDGQLIQTHTGSTNVEGSGRVFKDQQATVPNTFRYHYWTSPVVELGLPTYTVANVMKDGTTPTSEVSVPVDINFTASSYNGDTTTPITIANYWIWTFFDNVNRDDWVQTKENTAINRGQGYTMKSTGAASQNFTFVGTPNDGSITFNFSPNTTSLLGNPYPSSLDINDFISTNTDAIDGTIYFWEHTGEDNIGGWVEGHGKTLYEGGYSQRNISMGIAANTTVPGTLGIGGGTYTAPSRYAAVGQGFFVSSSAIGGTVRFENAHRAYNAGSFFFRSENTISDDTELLPVLKIGLEYYNENQAPIHRQIGVSFRRGNSFKYESGYDSEMYDLQPSDIYWKFNQSDKNLIIAGVRAIDEQLQVPLTIVIDTNEKVFLMMDEKKNINQYVYLFDNVENTYKPLTSPIELSLPKGTYSDRFYLVFRDDQKTLSTDDASLNKNDIAIFSDNETKEIVIKNNNNLTIKKIELFTLLGQKVKAWKQLNKTENRLNITPLAAAIYIVKAYTDKGAISKKIVVK